MAESMLDNDPAPASTSELSTALHDAFGVRFKLYEQPQELCDQPTAGAVDAEVPFEVQQLLEVADSSSTEPVVQRADGKRDLLIPIRITGMAPVVAAATFSAGDDELLVRMARLFVRHFRDRIEQERTESDLYVYARQVTDDFEELTFLRSLAECLDVGDNFSGRWNTAQSVLPFLRLAVKSESMVLIVAGPSADAGTNRPQVGPAIAWAGRRILSTEQCQCIIEQFRDAARHHPVVRNRLDAEQSPLRIDGLRGFALASISKQNEIFGWVLAINRHCEFPFAPDSDDEEIDQPDWGLSDLEFGTGEATLLASAAAVFASCARNVDLLQQKENLLVGIARALVSAIEARDCYTFGHSERVALTAQRLAEQLGLGKKHSRRLYLTGLLHDVGKIGISDQLLKKPGKLTPAEFDEVKKHVELGHSILQDLDQLHFVLPGVLHHHEWLNGSGYPHGLAGDEIPLDARIIAVADAYDAMASDRPYRPGMSEDEVAQCLRDGAGVQWDPDVVDALFAACDEIRTIIDAYQMPPQAEISASGGLFPFAARASIGRSDLNDAVMALHAP